MQNRISVVLVISKQTLSEIFVTYIKIIVVADRLTRIVLNEAH